MRAARAPHGRLALSRGRARDEQARHVHARDDEQQTDAGEQHQQRRPEIAHGFRVQRHGTEHEPALPVARVLAARLRADARDLGLRRRRQ
jgi:hypothetical protein